MFSFWNGWSILATTDGTLSDVADVFNALHWLPSYENALP